MERLAFARRLVPGGFKHPAYRHRYGSLVSERLAWRDMRITKCYALGMPHWVQSVKAEAERSWESCLAGDGIVSLDELREGLQRMDTNFSESELLQVRDSWV